MPLTKKHRILALLRERAGLGLTALESLQLAGTMRLAPRVKELRDDGYAIDTEIVAIPSGELRNCRKQEQRDRGATTTLMHRRYSWMTLVCWE